MSNIGFGRRRRNSLAIFFILAFAFSWAIEIPLALQALGLTPTTLPFRLHYLAAFGPLLAALTMTYLTAGRPGLNELLGRMFRWRLRPAWWLTALAPLLVYLVIAMIRSLLAGAWLDLSLQGQIDFFPNLGFGALIFWIVTFGLGEETGWRGYALPRLQRGRSALSATLILWLFWALWHLPMFFYLYEPAILAGFLIGLLAGAITLTWLYNSTGGSILLVAVWHGAFNFTTACTTCKASTTAAILSAAVMVWAFLVVLLFRPINLSRLKKQIGEEAIVDGGL